jgi:hypothetical protein
MKDEIRYIETKNCKYPICFNLNVMEELQEEYGSITNWGNIVENKDGVEPKVKDLKKGLLIMINEGIDIENEDKDIKREFLNHKQVGRIISEIGIVKISEIVKGLAVSSAKSDEDLKNE